MNLKINTASCSRDPQKSGRNCFWPAMPCILFSFLAVLSSSYCHGFNAGRNNEHGISKAIAIQTTSYDITAFGAVGDGHTLNTVAIQKAIDKCSDDGGGQVMVPNGVFVSGTIYLKSNVQLFLNPGAVLKGSSNKEHYSATDNCLIAANNMNNIAVLGTGTIDGNGGAATFYSPDFANGLSHRPHLFSLSNCTNVKLRDFTVVNGASWNIHLINSDFVTVDGITVKSRVVANNDGIDFEDCHYVTVSNSYFDCGDDAICPKSTSFRGVKHMVINNCVIKSESNGIKFGTASVGGFEDIAVSNCTIYDTRLSGIAIQMVDGGTIDRMVISNIVMHNVNGSLFIKLGKRKGNTPGVLQNVAINNIVADGIGAWKPVTSDKYHKTASDPRIGISIVGQPGYLVKNINLTDVSLQFAGGGSNADSKSVMPDAADMYPEFTNFGITPAYGLNFRHVEGVVLRNVQLSTVLPDERPAIFFEDAKKIDISSLKASVSDLAGCFIKLKAVENVFVYNCRPDASPAPFLAFEEYAKDVSVINNDFRKLKTIYSKTANVDTRQIAIGKAQQ